MRKTLKIAVYLSAFVFLIAMFLAGILYGLFHDITKNLPSVDSLEHYRPNTVTSIYSKDKVLIKQFYEERREIVKLSDVSPIMQKAILAAEDTRFYKHHGFDIFSIARAAIKNLKAGRIVEGGSTITQQLAKQLFLTPERSFERKLKEFILSFNIERKFDKQRIFELYMNQIYFGHGAYGVEAAALTFFNKHAKNLNLCESALLAGLIKAPNKYSPVRHPELAKIRMSQVLNVMRDEGFINKEQEQKAVSRGFKLNMNFGSDSTGAYFVEQIRRELVERYGPNIFYRNGLKIFMTMDSKLQKAADEIIMKHLTVLNEKYPVKDSKVPNISKIQAALIAMNVRDGEVVAMSGGSDFEISEFNRALQAKRQPGSSFKPIIYTAALLSGMTPSDIIIDSPMVYGGANQTEEWRPENFDQKFLGHISLREALAKSRNVVTVKITEKVGLSKVIEVARKLGIKSNLYKDLALSLGSSAVTLLELTTAYNVFPSGGFLVKPKFYLSVEDGNGNQIEDSRTQSLNVLDPKVAYMMVNLLQSVIISGTGNQAAALGRPLAGKTGTTNDFRDAWFIGFSPSLIVGVWVGRDDMKPIGSMAMGARVALPIWIDFMKEYLQNVDNEDFEVPSGIIYRKIDPKTGLLVTDASGSSVDEVFIEGTEPKTYSGYNNVPDKSFMQYDLGM
jgi:penicillin-binding protein 1A